MGSATPCYADGMRNDLALLIALSMTLAGCPDDMPDDTENYDTPLADAPAPLDTPSMDAPSDDDAPSTDAPVASDVPPMTDTRVIPPGECADSEPCPPTCLIETSCVTECGGPVTSCGCCPCAPGSVDAMSCTDAE